MRDGVCLVASLNAPAGPKGRPLSPLPSGHQQHLVAADISSVDGDRRWGKVLQYRPVVPHHRAASGRPRATPAKGHARAKGPSTRSSGECWRQIKILRRNAVCIEREERCRRDGLKAISLLKAKRCRGCCEPWIIEKLRGGCRDVRHMSPLQLGTNDRNIGCYITAGNGSRAGSGETCHYLLFALYLNAKRRRRAKKVRPLLNKTFSNSYLFFILLRKS